MISGSNLLGRCAIRGTATRWRMVLGGCYSSPRLLGIIAYYYVNDGWE